MSRPAPFAGRVRRLLESSPGGLTVPEALAVLGLGTGRSAQVRNVLMDGVIRGWAVRGETRRGGRNVPRRVYRPAMPPGRYPGE